MKDSFLAKKEDVKRNITIKDSTDMYVIINIYLPLKTSQDLDYETLYTRETVIDHVA